MELHLLHTLPILSKSVLEEGACSGFIVCCDSTQKQELDGKVKGHDAGGIILSVRHITSVKPVCSHKRGVASLSA